MKARALVGAVSALVLSSSILLATGCGSGGPSPAPAPAPPPDTTTPPTASPQPPASPSNPPGNPAPSAPTSPPSNQPSQPGSPPSPPPAAGRTLWSYGAGAPQEGGAITAASDGSGNLVLGFHEGPGPGQYMFTLRLIDATGRQRWSRTIGGPGCETIGDVLGVAPGGTIYIDLVSNCATLPGFETRAAGEGGRFALDSTGQLLRAVHFGRDRAVVTTDGTLVALVRTAPPGIFLYAYGEDGARRWDRDGEYADVMRPTPDGGFVIAANRPPPVYVDRAPHVTRYRSDGSLAWTRDLPDRFVLEDAAVLDDGATAIAGFATGNVTWAGRDLGGAWGTPTLITMDAAGQPRSARNLEDGQALVTALQGGAVGVLTRGGCDHLWVYDSALQRRWERPVDASCSTRGSGLLGTPAGQLVVFGAYGGTADLGDGHATTAPGPQDAFVGSFAP